MATHLELTRSKYPYHDDDRFFLFFNQRRDDLVAFFYYGSRIHKSGKMALYNVSCLSSVVRYVLAKRTSEVVWSKMVNRKFSVR